jgi:hypothetical protein
MQAVLRPAATSETRWDSNPRSRFLAKYPCPTPRPTSFTQPRFGPFVLLGALSAVCVNSKPPAPARIASPLATRAGQSRRVNLPRLTACFNFTGRNLRAELRGVSLTSLTDEVTLLSTIPASRSLGCAVLFFRWEPSVRVNCLSFCFRVSLRSFDRLYSHEAGGASRSRNPPSSRWALFCRSNVHLHHTGISCRGNLRPERHIALPFRRQQL